MDKLRMVDTPLVVGLVTSPVWADVLNNINVLLTSLSLTAGLILGLIRIWFEIKKLFKDNDDDARNP